MADSYSGRPSRSPDHRWGDDSARSPASERWRGHARSRSPQPNGRSDNRRNDYHRRDREERGERADRGDRGDRGNDRDRRYGAIDRYVPGQDSAPARPPAEFHHNRELVRDPMTLDAQVGFAQFADWWRKSEAAKDGGRRPERDRETEKEYIQAAYDVYKERFAEKAAKQFVLSHKGDEWFKERYDPLIAATVEQKLAVYRRDLWQHWAQELRDGAYDEFNLEGIYKSESNGAGGLLEREEGEAPMTSEFQAVNDLVPSKGANMKDESVYQPTLLIKTIAPGVSRQELEDLCREHLGEGPGGYRWLSLSEVNPSKKFHRIGWVLLNPGDEIPAEREEMRDEGEMDDNSKKEESSVATSAVEALNEKTIHSEARGDFTCHVGVHAPPRDLKKKALWDLFSAPERIEKDLRLATQLAENLEMQLNAGGGSFSGVSLIESRVEELRAQGLLHPAVPKPDKNDEEMDDGEIGGGPDEEVDSEELLVLKKKLDLIVDYLRRTFHFCFFCVHGSDSVHELTRKCASGHLRRPRSSLTSAAKEAARASARGEPLPIKKGEAEDGEVEEPGRRRKVELSRPEQQLQKAYGWVKTYEEKLAAFLAPEQAPLRKHGGRPIEEALPEELKLYVKQEDENKYRCKVPDCKKLFRSEEFWRNHVEKRHEDWFEGLKNDLLLVNAYAADPNRIAPGKTDQASNGHFPLPPGGRAGGLPGPGQEHGVGPVRRRDGMNGARRNTPYDRRDGRDGRDNRGGRDGRDGRDGRGYQNGGSIGGGRMGGGPREAVLGRSLKSYDDLDSGKAGDVGASNGNGGGGRPTGGPAPGEELDY